MPPARERVRVVGVDCPTCVLAIQEELRKVGAELDVDIATGDAIVVYDPSRTSLAEVYRAVRGAGYDLEKASLTLSVRLGPEGAPSFEERVSRPPGVFTCRFSPASGLARITYNPLSATPEQILRAIESLGYAVEGVGEEGVEGRGLRPLWVPLASLSLGLPVIALHVSEAAGWLSPQGLERHKYRGV